MYAAYRRRSSGILRCYLSLAVARFLAPHTQIVVVGTDAAASSLYRAVRDGFLRTRLSFDWMRTSRCHRSATSPGDTIPHLPALRDGRSFA